MATSAVDWHKKQTLPHMFTARKHHHVWFLPQIYPADSKFRAVGDPRSKQATSAKCRQSFREHGNYGEMILCDYVKSIITCDIAALYVDD